VGTEAGASRMSVARRLFCVRGIVAILDFLSAVDVLFLAGARFARAMALRLARKMR
jgi:hypothetical protein